MSATLTVIGAGPKGVAIAAKAACLRKATGAGPEVHLIEARRAGAHWRGSAGYTDGRQCLGTSPLKDIGFPYAHPDRAVDAHMRRFSWASFLTSPAATLDLAGWVDRGCPAPSHAEWSRYLEWAAIECGASIIHGRVVAAEPRDGVWAVHYESPDGPGSINTDGLVVTGPGPSQSLSSQPDHPRVVTGRSLWHSLDRARGLEANADPVVVIGAGETAAASVVSLLREGVRAPILVLNRQGTVYSRGESYAENRLYSDPSDWRDMPEAERLEFIRRTDRSVFSLQAKRVIDLAPNVLHRRVDVAGVDVEDGDQLVVRARDSGLSIPASFVVVAVGFDAWWFLDLLPSELRSRLQVDPSAVVRSIGYDLAFPENLVQPRLHAPMLAGFAQGPGFPNLSCLGLLADRVLQPYRGVA